MLNISVVVILTFHIVVRNDACRPPMTETLGIGAPITKSLLT